MKQNLILVIAVVVGLLAAFMTFRIWRQKTTKWKAHRASIDQSIAGSTSSRSTSRCRPVRY